MPRTLFAARLLALLTFAVPALAAAVPKGIRDRRPTVAEAVVGEWESADPETGLTARVTFTAEYQVEFRSTLTSTGRGGHTMPLSYGTAEPDAKHPLGRTVLETGTPGSGCCQWIITILSPEVLEYEAAAGKTERYQRVRAK